MAKLYGPGTGGPSDTRYIEDVEVQMTDANTLDVFLDERQYAWFHHWYAETAFETIGSDDRGYPECNWPTPPPRPSPPQAKCIDRSDSIAPTVNESPTSSPHTDPPCAFEPSGCRKNWVSIHYRDGREVFKGRVHTEQNKRCLNHRRVVLQRFVSGEPTVVGSDETTERGYWRIPSGDSDGKSYRVLVRKAVKPAGELTLICRRMASDFIRP